AGSQTAITGSFILAGPNPTLRLDGATTWSVGTVQINNAGAFENAGVLQVTGTVAVGVFFNDQGRRMRVLAGGTTVVSGSLSVASEIENDGTLRVVDGGSLVQSGQVASPPDSAGAFIAEGSGVLSVSNVLMGTGSSASGSGTIRF